ncbi:MAG TPA: hypothetical protein VF042_12390 [Gemmatimonadaceae bacterium]
MKTLVKIILLAELFAVATYAFGWWTVPIIAALWTLLSRDTRRIRMAAFCAALGWATLLALDTVKGPVPAMATRLGGVMHVPSIVLIILTLVLPALLAWSAAALVAGRRPTSPTPASRPA